MIQNTLIGSFSGIIHFKMWKYSTGHLTTRGMVEIGINVNKVTFI